MKFFNIVTLEKNKNDKDYKKGGKVEQKFWEFINNASILHKT